MRSLRGLPDGTSMAIFDDLEEVDVDMARSLPESHGINGAAFALVVPKDAAGAKDSDVPTGSLEQNVSLTIGVRVAWVLPPVRNLPDKMPKVVEAKKAEAPVADELQAVRISFYKHFVGPEIWRELVKTPPHVLSRILLRQSREVDGRAYGWRVEVCESVAIGYSNAERVCIQPLLSTGKSDAMLVTEPERRWNESRRRRTRTPPTTSAGCRRRAVEAEGRASAS